jgi:hypothetical protein
MGVTNSKTRWGGGSGWCMTKTGVKHTRRRDPVHILSIRGMQRVRKVTVENKIKIFNQISCSVVYCTTA